MPFYSYIASIFTAANEKYLICDQGVLLLELHASAIEESVEA
jgi:hypothetical protein